MNRKSANVVIRKMMLKDYDSVISLWKQGDIPYRPQGRDSKEDIRRQLRQATSLYYVAENDGVIIGVILGTHDGRKGWINRLAVTPAYHRKGIARRLVEEVEHHLAARGIDIVACLIENWNATSMQVFDRFGYTKHDEILYYSKRKNKRI